MIPTNARYVSILAALFGCAAALGQQKAAPAATQPATTRPATTQRIIEPKADELLRKMSEQLAKIGQFRMEAEVLLDEVTDDDQKIQLSNRFSVLEKRPNDLCGEFGGDRPISRFWFDGQQLTILQTERNVYSVVKAPGTIDAMIEFTSDRYGWTFPLSDLLLSNTYEALTGEVLTGHYLGIHRVGEHKCHHLAFTQDALDWQIWIDEGDQPLPRKLLIDYKDMPGDPQFMATIVKWDTKPEIKPGEFKFEPPQGATKIEMLPVEPEQQK